MILVKWELLKEYDSTIGIMVSDFMNKNDVSTIATGRYELTHGCYVNVYDYETIENNSYEAHRKYIDVQLMVDGEEDIICAPLSHGTETISYNSEKDIAFYKCDNGPCCTVKLKPQLAVVLTPWDMHAPCNSTEKRQNRKLIFKIPVELDGGKTKKRITCCGDSITFGALATAEDKSYPSVLQQLLGDSYKVENCGRNGATVIADYELVPNRYAPYLKSPEYATAMMSEPDVAILMLGMNDANPTHHFNSENGGPISDKYIKKYEETLKRILDNLAKLPSKPELILAKTTAMKRVVGKLFNEAYIENFTNNLIIIRKIQEKVAKEYQIPLVDTLSGMDNMDFYRDGCHMTDAGYQNLAEIMYKHILK